MSLGKGRVEIWRGDPKGFRFQIPLIKPGVRLSRDRLSDKVAYAFAHGRLAVEPVKQNKPSFSLRYWSLKRFWPELFN
jgi:hypothetical protein